MKYLYRETQLDALYCVAEYKELGYAGYVVGKIGGFWEVRVWKA